MFKNYISLYVLQFLGNCGTAKSRSFLWRSLPLMEETGWIVSRVGELPRASKGIVADGSRSTSAL